MRKRRSLAARCRQAIRLVAWQREMKHAAMRLTASGPQATAMGLDDRAADRQTHTHAVWFGGEHGLEDPLDIFLADSSSGVLDRDRDRAVTKLGAYAQKPALCGDCHRLDRVRDQIQQQLLQLNLVAL